MTIYKYFSLHSPCNIFFFFNKIWFVLFSLCGGSTFPTCFLIIKIIFTSFCPLNLVDFQIMTAKLMIATNIYSPPQKPPQWAYKMNKPDAIILFGL